MGEPAPMPPRTTSMEFDAADLDDLAKSDEDVKPDDPESKPPAAQSAGLVDNLELKTEKYSVEGTTFEVDARYKITELRGRGPQGIVCCAEDLEERVRVELRKVEQVFEHPTGTKRTLRELRILRNIQHENVVRILNVFMCGSRHGFQDVYVVSEIMESDLASILKFGEPLLEESHRQFILYQILRGIKYVHSAHVIHRDLKPRNILVDGNCDLKICDFGLARVRFSEKDWVCPMTEYICTRWYRAPEVLCSWTHYSCAIDLWSIGCILAEMLMQKPLFPGGNTQNQLDLIIALLGTPKSEEMMKIPNDKCRKFIGALNEVAPRDLSEVFPGSVPEAQEFLGLCLKWDPDARISADVAITHQYLEEFHCPEDEPVTVPLVTSEFEFERRKVTSAAFREELFREMLNYHPRILARYNTEKGVDEEHDISSCRLLKPGELQFSDSDDAESD